MNSAKSHAYGVMKNSMPLAQNDELFSEQSVAFSKSTDKSTYDENAQQVKKIFSNKVTPFVS